MSLTDMAKKVHPIAKISRVSGLHGEVRLQPLSRYFDEYIETRGLQIGFDPEMDLVCERFKVVEDLQPELKP